MTRSDFNAELSKVTPAVQVLLDTVPLGLKGPEWQGARTAVDTVIRSLQVVEQRLPKDLRPPTPLV